MKDQYFGDVNDYRKYGLLRYLVAKTKLRFGVCWMLTTPDGRIHGRKLGYLENPQQFRQFDPDLFDWLRETVHERSDRRTGAIEKSDLLGEAVYYSALLADGCEQRRVWFSSCRRHLAGCDVVFFDPDNGIQRHIGFGRRESHKYLYWSEIGVTFTDGASVLIYQHFPREPRGVFVRRIADDLRAETGAAAIFSFTTPHVLFLLAAQGDHVDAFHRAIGKFSEVWPERELAAKQVGHGSYEAGGSCGDSVRGSPQKRGESD